MLFDPMPGGPILSFTLSDLDALYIGTYRCPRGTKVSCSQEKIMNITKLPGRSGSIKEFSGFDDWKLTVEFEYVSPNKTLTHKELLEIKSMWKVEDCISIKNSKLNKLGILYAVITRIDFPNEDRDHELPVRLEAVSDDPDQELDDPDSGDEL